LDTRLPHVFGELDEEALSRGTSHPSEMGGEPPDRFRKGRKCKNSRCRKTLSIFNPDRLCFTCKERQ